MPAFAGPQDIAWNGSSPVVVSTIIVFVVIIAVLIVWAVIIQEKHRREKLKEFSEQKFKSLAGQFGLNSGELFELHRLVKAVTPVSPEAVFSSVSIFEEAVDKECQNIVKKWGTTAKADSAVLPLRTIRNKIGYNHLPFEVPLASTRNVEIGQFIALSLPGTQKVAVEQAVASINGELELVVKYPVGEELFKIDTLREITVNFTRNGDGYYTVMMKVISIDLAKGKVVLGHSIDMDRNQLRKHVRMIVNLPLKCRVINRSSRDRLPAPGQMVEESILIDIGGGGLAFISEQELDPDDTVSLVFALSRKTYAIKGSIVAVIPQEGNRGVKFKHRVAFKAVDQSDVEHIVKYIFSKQREQLALLR